jgi:hypothetical protein
VEQYCLLEVSVLNHDVNTHCCYLVSMLSFGIFCGMCEIHVSMRSNIPESNDVNTAPVLCYCCYLASIFCFGIFVALFFYALKHTRIALLL